MKIIYLIQFIFKIVFFNRLAPFKSEIDQNIRDSQTLKNARQKHISALLITTIVPLILSIIVH